MIIKKKGGGKSGGLNAQRSSYFYLKNLNKFLDDKRGESRYGPRVDDSNGRDLAVFWMEQEEEVVILHENYDDGMFDSV